MAKGISCLDDQDGNLRSMGTIGCMLATLYTSRSSDATTFRHVPQLRYVVSKQCMITDMHRLIDILSISCPG